MKFPVIAFLTISGALMACSADVTPIGTESAADTGRGAPGAGSSRTPQPSGSTASGADSGTTPVGTDGGETPDGASCSSTALPGSYYLSYDNGQPFDYPQEHTAQIVINSNMGVPAIYVNALVYVGAQACDTTLFCNAMIDGGPWAIGTQPYGDFTTDGEYGPNDTSFTWVLNEALTFNNFYGQFAGVTTNVSLTEPSPCEVKYEVTHVRNDFPDGTQPPTSADMVTDTFLLQRQ
jgi:hypothetical protein